MLEGRQQYAYAPTYLVDARRPERELACREQILATVVDGAGSEYGGCDYFLEAPDDVHVEPSRKGLL